MSLLDCNLFEIYYGLGNHLQCLSTIFVAGNWFLGMNDFERRSILGNRHRKSIVIHSLQGCGWRRLRSLLRSRWTLALIHYS